MTIKHSSSSHLLSTDHVPNCLEHTICMISLSCRGLHVPVKGTGAPRGQGAYLEDTSRYSFGVGKEDLQAQIYPLLPLPWSTKQRGSAQGTPISCKTQAGYDKLWSHTPEEGLGFGARGGPGLGKLGLRDGSSSSVPG